MTITFKDVGQGDSLLIEWEHETVKKIGLIDCRQVGGRNPVVDYIKTSGYKEIEFIILSHPHNDHYSGFENLLSFIESNGISVQRFGHTLYMVGSRYWSWFEVGINETQQLERIVHKVDELRDSETIKSIEHITENWRIEMTDNIYLKCLSPSQQEGEMYQHIVKLDPETNRKEASRAANLLSTIFKISSDKNYIILTSDGEKVAFDRLFKYDLHSLSKKNLQLCQLPHHGSSKNFSIDFWESLSLAKGIAVASAGQHHHYAHPDLDVLKYFDTKGFTIKCTNVVNGMAEFLKLKEASLILDTGSELAEELMLGGDHKINFMP